MILAIHQPNFMPWYPFFQKMQGADVFVFLTECQYERRGYQNRFMYNGEWQTMRVFKGEQKDLIRDKQYFAPDEDWAEIRKGLPKKYIFDMLEACIEPGLAQTNMNLITIIARLLGIKTDLRVDVPTLKSGTDRLIELCQIYGCDTYYSGVSGAAYMDMSRFAAEDIQVIFQDVRTMDKRSCVEVLNGGF